MIQKSIKDLHMYIYMCTSIRLILSDKAHMCKLEQKLKHFLKCGSIFWQVSELEIQFTHLLNCKENFNSYNSNYNDRKLVFYLGFCNKNFMLENFFKMLLISLNLSLDLSFTFFSSWVTKNFVHNRIKLWNIIDHRFVFLLSNIIFVGYHKNTGKK